MAVLGKGAWFAHTASLLCLVLSIMIEYLIILIMYFFKNSAESLPHLVGGTQ